MNDEQSPRSMATTPPPPPPPPPAAPQPTYAPAGHDQTGPIPEFAQAPTQPAYQQMGPSQGYPHAGPIQGFQQAEPTQGYQQSAPTGYPTAPPVPPAGTGGMPAWQAAPAPRPGPSFLRSLFDFSFHSFITRRLAPVIYGIGLVAIGIGALIALFSGLAGAFAALSSSFTAGVGALMLIGSLIGVPLVTLIFVIVLRLSVEAGIALVAVAENTERTASNTEATEAH